MSRPTVVPITVYLFFFISRIYIYIYIYIYTFTGSDPPPLKEGQSVGDNSKDLPRLMISQVFLLGPAGQDALASCQDNNLGGLQS